MKTLTIEEIIAALSASGLSVVATAPVATPVATRAPRRFRKVGAVAVAATVATPVAPVAAPVAPVATPVAPVATGATASMKSFWAEARNGRGEVIAMRFFDARLIDKSCKEAKTFATYLRSRDPREQFVDGGALISAYTAAKIKEFARGKVYPIFDNDFLQAFEACVDSPISITTGKVSPCQWISVHYAKRVLGV